MVQSFLHNGGKRQKNLKDNIDKEFDVKQKEGEEEEEEEEEEEGESMESNQFRLWRMERGAGI